jgi:hypothetical protein
MITRNTAVVNRAVPDLTLEQFQAILEATSSPALVEAAQCYDAVVKQGVSPAMALAIFNQESGMGSNGFATANRSPGNTRSSTTGIGITVNTAKGSLIRYPSWYEGFRDLAWRLVAPKYVYALEGRKTIEQIIYKWAPPQENNTENYIRNVVTWINQWIGAAQPMEIIDLTANTPSKVFTPRLLPISEVVLHETSGPPDKNSNSLEAVKSANANTIRWFQGAATTGVSIHYYIGPEKMGAPIYRLCNEQNTAYHAIGDKGFYVNASKDNHMSIGIERFGYPTEPVGPNQQAALLWLVADIASRRKLKAEQIISHASIQSDRTDGRILLEASREAVRNGGTNQLNEQQVTKPFNPNPKNFVVGQGVLDKAAAEKMEIITNEQFFSPNPDQPAGLTQRSYTWASKNGIIYMIVGIQDEGKPTWTMQAWLQSA